MSAFHYARIPEISFGSEMEKSDLIWLDWTARDHLLSRFTLISRMDLNVPFHFDKPVR